MQILQEQISVHAVVNQSTLIFPFVAILSIYSPHTGLNHEGKMSTYLWFISLGH
jgi:hypothetical protein